MRVLFALVLVLFAMISVPAEAAITPLGFLLFCAKNSEQCTSGGSSSIALNDETLQILKSVNSRVNSSISPRSDRGDIWNMNVSSGDCEDYVLTKRARLISSGFPPSALRIAVVTISTGEQHAVLIVKTNQGDLVLDNLSGSIKSFSDTGYRSVSISGANPMTWSSF